MNLAVGSRAKLVAVNGQDVTLKLTSPKTSRPGLRARVGVEIREVAVSADTIVTVLAVDGEDARIRIEDGPETGLITWVEASLLETDH
jgi:hypothetical protein